MHKFDAPLMERSGFIEKLNAMMMDSHKEVLTSAVAALFDISERSTTIQLNLNFKQANNLAGRLLECSECTGHVVSRCALNSLSSVQRVSPSIAGRITA